MKFICRYYFTQIFFFTFFTIIIYDYHFKFII